MTGRKRADVLLVELFPFGRRKFADELIPLLEDARRPPRALVLSSVRDILANRGLDQLTHDDCATDGATGVTGIGQPDEVNVTVNGAEDDST